MHVVGRQLCIQGFLAEDLWGDQYRKATLAIRQLFADGKIKWKEALFAWDDFPSALDGLLTGTKFGKVCGGMVCVGATRLLLWCVVVL